MKLVFWKSLNGNITATNELKYYFEEFSNNENLTCDQLTDT